MRSRRFVRNLLNGFDLKTIAEVAGGGGGGGDGVALSEAARNFDFVGVDNGRIIRGA
jgi:hypothetical protein